jgi:hypothetical protein
MLDAKRTREWSELLASIRQKHGRKTRLMDVLDGLEHKPIVRSERRGPGRGRTRRT